MTIWYILHGLAFESRIRRRRLHRAESFNQVDLLTVSSSPFFLYSYIRIITLDQNYLAIGKWRGFNDCIMPSIFIVQRSYRVNSKWRKSTLCSPLDADFGYEADKRQMSEDLFRLMQESGWLLHPQAAPPYVTFHIPVLTNNIIFELTNILFTKGLKSGVAVSPEQICRDGDTPSECLHEIRHHHRRFLNELSLLN